MNYVLPHCHDFVYFARDHGLILDYASTGKWVRVPTEDKPTKRNGAYFFDGDYGFVQNWATMETVAVWQTEKAMTPADKAALARRIEISKKAALEERIKAQCRAADKANSMLGRCRYDKHAYLDSKGFPNMPGWVCRDDEKNPLLLVPMFYRKAVVGCQMISVDGTKRFLKGQRTNDAIFKMGDGGKLFLVEGYASGLSLQKILSLLKIKHTIYVCFSANNLGRMAVDSGAWIIADNDESGTGQSVAEKSGCRFWMPPEVGFDINDWHQEKGLFNASQDIRRALMKE